jgi:REP element-mobilizing transposase RayT
VTFVEIGTDKDHVHFLIQSVPSYSPTQIARIVKSITAREIFRQIPSVKKALWGQPLGTSGQGRCLLDKWFLYQQYQSSWQ